MNTNLAKFSLFKQIISICLSALFLVVASSWSSLAIGLDCACEVATGACRQCCGSMDSGHKHCSNGSNKPTPPAALERSQSPAKNSPEWNAEELPAANHKARRAKEQEDAGKDR